MQILRILRGTQSQLKCLRFYLSTLAADSESGSTVSAVQSVLGCALGRGVTGSNRAVGGVAGVVGELNDLEHAEY